MKIREVLLSEVNELSEFVLYLKVMWNYSEEFIFVCKEDLIIMEEYIKNNFVYVLVNDNVKIGFFLFLCNDKVFDFLYIYFYYKGKGYGKIFWEYVIEKVNELGLKSFIIDSDLNVKGYYLKMGV